MAFDFLEYKIIHHRFLFCMKFILAKTFFNNKSKKFAYIWTLVLKKWARTYINKKISVGKKSL